MLGMGHLHVFEIRTVMQPINSRTRVAVAKEDQPQTDKNRSRSLVISHMSCGVSDGILHDLLG